MRGLSHEDQEILRRLILTRAMLRQCEGWNPEFLQIGQSLFSWFGFESEEEVVEYHDHLVSLFRGRPELRRVLAKRRWYIKWKGERWSLAYHGQPSEVLASAQFRWLAGGVLLGTAITCAIVRPRLFETTVMLVYQITLLLFSSAAALVMSILSSVWLFEVSVRHIDPEFSLIGDPVDSSPWTPMQKVLLWTFLACGISFSLYAIGVTFSELF